jgi:hypothetical protein
VPKIPPAFVLVTPFATSLPPKIPGKTAFAKSSVKSSSTSSVTETDEKVYIIQIKMTTVILKPAVVFKPPASCRSKEAQKTEIDYDAAFLKNLLGVLTEHNILVVKNI